MLCRIIRFPIKNLIYTTLKTWSMCQGPTNLQIIFSILVLGFNFITLGTNLRTFPFSRVMHLCEKLQAALCLGSSVDFASQKYNGTKKFPRGKIVDMKQVHFPSNTIFLAWEFSNYTFTPNHALNCFSHFLQLPYR